MATVTLSNVGKTYAGGVDAVRGVDVEIKDGEFVVLVGPSGCGKSTMLRMVAGLEDVTRGEVRIGDRVVNTLDPADRDIAMVFQNYALYPHMSVRDNMAYGLKNRRTPKDEITRRVDEAARMLELAPYLDRKPRALSGGQRQRVAMGRAIVRQPSAFLFDEPLSNLDAKLRVSMRGEIRRLQKRLATTSLYVTHDQLEAMTLADRLIVLRDGAVEQVGAPLEVYRRPASAFVAAFIGSPAMTLLDARVSDGQALVGDHVVAPAAVPAGEVTLGLRPEDLRITRDGPLPMRVDYIEELGAQRIVHGFVDGQKIAVTETGAESLPADLRLSVDPGALHLFDVKTGRRLPQTVTRPEAVPA
ncbi:sn-glycerol-3-phosphate ABC transporter ATP-binding protein UgpC [Salipiger sp. IMCC34102]|uniref:sn-glycerol-3-phosphate ABC transporter ATP-binding protein UgpC n=1 Tax=Salipiger sp. IMCC34102 TaxID=2510647 RepID=UPI00101CAE6B|nr:sn-glycerol-3-phosphate ABC transporter ATP-binding protein UgpC [Salipiger sp. IMCC34102]RYH01379.1 sn-glycerol-3-phosphate ABC transporter ATP-binding protein UgpC [Salipiger sp. IMCC34102]